MAGGEMDAAIFVGIEISGSKFNQDDDINISFSHGHDVQKYYIEEKSSVLLLEISIYNSLTKETHIIYTKEYLDSEYFIEDFRVDTNWLAGSKIKFNQTIELGINFSEYDIKDGRVLIQLSESYSYVEIVNGDEVLKDFTSIFDNYIEFSINDGKIEFNN